MAVLRVVQGAVPGQVVEIAGDRVVMGRHPQCQVVLDNAAVSRTHAQILESHGTYYLEDLRSRNGTLLNGQKIRGRTELSDGDEIKVCEVVMTFHESLPAGGAVGAEKPAARDPMRVSGLIATVAGEVMSKSSADTGPNPEENSSIISSVELGGPLAAGAPIVRPEVRLRAVMEIGHHLARTLELDEVLPKILESLFHIFPQADRGFVMLRDPETGHFTVKAMRLRRADMEEGAQVSMTIVRQAVNSRRALLSADAVDDHRFEISESLHNLKLRSLMCAPFVGHDGAVYGVMQLDRLDVYQQFSQDDLDVLASVAAQATLAIENADLHTSLIKKRDMERELEFASQVQMGFLPTERPRLPGYQFYDFYEAASGVGGDFFDYVPLPDGRVAIGLGDVAGKGVPAALLMARLYSAARYELLTRGTPAAAMSGLNATLTASGLGHRFVTLVFAVLDPKRHTATIVNAGHLSPLVRSANREVRKIIYEESGLPLGIKSDAVYQQTEIPFAPDDTLLLYTDGVTEAMNPLNEMYGMNKLMDFMSAAPS